MTRDNTLVEIRPFVLDQCKLLYGGLHVGYCGTEPGMPVNFLAGKNCTLSDEQRADVLSAVILTMGHVKVTPQTARLFDLLEARAAEFLASEPDETHADEEPA